MTGGKKTKEWKKSRKKEKTTKKKKVTSRVGINVIDSPGRLGFGLVSLRRCISNEEPALNDDGCRVSVGAYDDLSGFPSAPGNHVTPAVDLVGVFSLISVTSCLAAWFSNVYPKSRRHLTLEGSKYCTSLTRSCVRMFSSPTRATNSSPDLQKRPTFFSDK